MMRRYHAIEVARYYKRLENIEKRQQEQESQKQKRKGLIARLIKGGK